MRPLTYAQLCASYDEYLADHGLPTPTPADYDDALTEWVQGQIVSGSIVDLNGTACG